MVVANQIHRVPGSQAVATPKYSADFKVKAQAALDAVERLQFYSGALPKYEAAKAMTELLHLSSNSVGEGNAYSVLANYKFAIAIAKIGTTRKEWAKSQGNQPFPDLDKARADVYAIRMNLY